jgi:hypothetical protein
MVHGYGDFLISNAPLASLLSSVIFFARWLMLQSRIERSGQRTPDRTGETIQQSTA